MQSHSLGESSKFYLALVIGKFEEGVQDIIQPIDVSNYRGKHCVGTNGKYAHTRVAMLGYDETQNRSLVACQLFTGRTHQIRVHLHWKGFPIVQDPLYNFDPVDKHQQYFDEINVFRRDETRGSNNKPTENQSALDTPIVEEKAVETITITETQTQPKPEKVPGTITITETQIQPEPMQRKETETQEEPSKPEKIANKGEQTTEVSEEVLVGACPDCRVEGSQWDPTESELFFYLHAYCYSRKDSSGKTHYYMTEKPTWTEKFEVPETLDKLAPMFFETTADKQAKKAHEAEMNEANK